MWLVPRGAALCLSPTAEAALDQAVQALRVGAAALLVAPGATSAAKPLIEAGLPVAALDGATDASEVSEIDAGAVGFCGEETAMRALRKAIASRDGPIVPLISERIYPAAWAHERAICIDTTAAGGNAALLGSV